MINGIGIDLIEIKRIEKLIQKHQNKFLERTFTLQEIAYCQKKAMPAQHYAARFAAKEALIKAVGKPLVLKEIEVKRPLGKAPQISLSGEAEKVVATKKILLSISHDHEYAIAQVIIQNKLTN